MMPQPLGGFLIKHLIIIIVICVAAATSVISQNDLTDENRPYEFGFNIEGYQHRHEKKDEKGIIMGEFGFITGDGVYHLTVYATDENGNFKILKMKNTYIGLPKEKKSIPIPGLAQVMPQKVNQVTTGTKKKLSGITACGGCLIPPIIIPEKELNRISQISKPGTQLKTSNFGTNNYDQHNIFPQVKQDDTYSQLQHSVTPKNEIKMNQLPEGDLLTKNHLDEMKFMDPYKTKNTHEGALKNSLKNKLNNNYEHKKMNVTDLMAILYKFNYTLSYHGHNEIGNRAGEKNGSYFFHGRDGFGTSVKYIANEFGYQPNITLVGLNINETPKEETEKLLTNLLGNEFIWYY